MSYKKHGIIPVLREIPEEERPREKIFARGVGTLSNAELIAVLIGSGTKGESALTLASKVLALCEDSLADLTLLEPEELSSIKGIGRAKACKIASAVELGRRLASAPGSKRPKLNCASKVAALFMEDLRYMGREVFRVAMLNIKSELLTVEDVSIGGLNASFAHPREVFRTAIRKGAHGIILVHNHPSGDPAPSPADIETTGRLASAGQLLGIEVLDHIIIGDGRYVSLKEENIF